jgi:hypothetical protein
MAKSKNHSQYNTYKWVGDMIVYKDKCFECEKENVDIHFHHIIPEVRGGKKTIPLCPTCHGLVHNRNFEHHKELQRIGIEKAKLAGKFMGRKPESRETLENFLNKDKTKKIIELLNNGYGIRSIMRMADCANGTVYKVKKLLSETTPDEKT